MTGLPVPLEILQETRLQMHMGRSVAASLKVVVDARTDIFTKSLKLWLVRLEAGQKHQTIVSELSELNQTPNRRQLVNILERGICGSSIDSALKDLEGEYFFAISNGFERKLQLLPLKLMMPLTLCILPGVMLLILAPFLFSMKGGF